jgi:hypothetical protein
MLVLNIIEGKYNTQQTFSVTKVHGKMLFASAEE